MTENAETPAETDLPANDEAAPAAEAQPDRNFSQADLDRIVKDRLARQRAQFADYDQIKAKLTEIEQASMSELEKAKEKAAQLEQQIQEKDRRAQEALLRAAVISEAAKKNVVDPDAVLALLDRSALEFDQDGSPTNIGDAIDALLVAKTYLAGNTARTPAGPADLGARGTNPGAQLTRDDLKNMSPDDIVKAEQEGRLTKLLTGGA